MVATNTEWHMDQIRLLSLAGVRAGAEILNPNMKQALFAGVTVNCGQI